MNTSAFFDRLFLKITGRQYFVSTVGLNGIEIIFISGEKYVLDGWRSGSVFCTKREWFKMVRPGKINGSEKSLEEIANLINQDRQWKIRIKIKEASEN